MTKAEPALTLTADEPEEAEGKSVQIDPDNYAKLTELAAEAERTIQKQTNRVLRQALSHALYGN